MLEQVIPHIERDALRQPLEPGNAEIIAENDRAFKAWCGTGGFDGPRGHAAHMDGMGKCISWGQAGADRRTLARLRKWDVRRVMGLKARRKRGPDAKPDDVDMHFAETVIENAIRSVKYFGITPTTKRQHIVDRITEALIPDQRRRPRRSK